MSEQQRPFVGVGVIIRKEGKILIGERLSSHGAGTFQIPGGHLEFGETFEECAEREAKEETGLTVKVVDLIAISNDRQYEKHYVTIGMLADWVEGDVSNPEKEHSGNWQWMDPKDIPENMFPHSKRNIDNWLSGKIYNP